jgi:hypothetical protein
MINQSPNIGMPEGPTCKKIQNYIFKFSDLLGQGNFSKVYKARHEITGTLSILIVFRLNCSHQDSRTKLPKIKETRRAFVFLN